MLTYESQLNADLDYALREGSMHFSESNAVHQTLRNISRRLQELGIEYAIVGGMALFAHGFRRFTEDVDLLVTSAGMERIREELEGLGYTRPAGTSTKLRDVTTGVRIEFLIAGHYPGDGKQKPVAFPPPADVGVEIDGIRYLKLPKLVELKLASGISAAHRLKDLSDVQELIRVLHLPRTLADELDPSVRTKFLELYDAVAAAPSDD
jgi:hypothetical protein